MNSINKLFSSLSGKKIIALIGRSGTGKSFRAKLTAQKFGINYIIDDGLLIHNNTILGGKSAKKEDLYLKAIKTAVFADESHRKEVAYLIKKHKINKLLIIGTSEKMANLICKRLKISPPSKIVKIEDISSQEEINRAIESRTRDGKHVIPVPTVEIRKNYPNIIAESLQIFFKKRVKKGINRNKGGKVIEKSVIRPDFSLKGAVSISESALAQMIYHCADEFNSEYVIKKLLIKDEGDSFSLKIKLILPYGANIAGALHDFQQYIISSIEKYTGIFIKKLDIDVAEIKD